MKQMKTKARLFALCLGLLMLAAFAGSVLVVFADADVKAFGDGGHNAQSVPEGKGVVGMHIGVNGEFSAFSFVMPTWTVSGKYSAYLSVYRWDTDYDTTVAAEPILKQTFEDFEDNSTLSMDFGSVDEKAFGAGTYLLVAKDGIDTQGTGVGVWTGPRWQGDDAEFYSSYDFVGYANGRVNKKNIMKATLMVYGYHAE